MRMDKIVLLAILMLVIAPPVALCQDKDFVNHCSRILDEMSKHNSKWQEYAHFFRTRVKRARLEGEVIKASEEGVHGRNFWVLSVDPQEREKLGLASLFEYQSEKDVLILPSHGYTPPFFFLGMLHELVHARDVLEGKEKRKPTEAQFYRGEMRAFHIELEAIDILTKGRFRKLVKEIALKGKVASLKGIKIPSEEAEDLLNRLTAFPFPRSLNESAQRRALYTVAINFELLGRDQDKMSFLKRSHHAFGQSHR